MAVSKKTPEVRIRLRRRIAPSYEIVFSDLLDDDGTKFSVKFRLSFDMNVIILIEKRIGLGVANGEVWDYLAEKLNRRNKAAKQEYSANPSVADVVRTMLWAAAQPHHGDELTEEEGGLEIMGSYVDFSNFGWVTFELEKAFVATVPEHQRKAMQEAAASETGGERPLVEGSQPTGSGSGPSPSTSESQKTTSAA